MPKHTPWLPGGMSSAFWEISTEVAQKPGGTGRVPWGRSTGSSWGGAVGRAEGPASEAGVITPMGPVPQSPAAPFPQEGGPSSSFHNEHTERSCPRMGQPYPQLKCAFGPASVAQAHPSDGPVDPEPQAQTP